MTARDALTAKIRFLREREARQQANLTATRGAIAALIALRDGLTDEDAAKIDGLIDSGVIRPTE